MRSAFRHCTAGLIAALIAVAPARAAEPSSSTVGALFNWYYATSFGSGLYQLGDSSVMAVNIPFRYTMREATETDWGWRFQLPVTVGLGDFTLRDPNLGQIDLAAVAFLPGVEFIFPVRPEWRVNTFVNVGVARELETRSNASLYRVGMTTDYRVPGMREPDLELGFKYVYAAYGTGGVYAEPISLAAVGISTSMALPGSLSDSRQTRLGVRAGLAVYLTEVRFREPVPIYSEINNEREFGLALIFRPGYKFLGMTWDRVGLNYVRANNGLHGVRLETEFPF